MKGIELNTKNNYSRAGRASAKVFSYVIDKAEKINEILKDKQHKRYLDQDYFEKEDKHSFDDSKELNFEDIFDKNYKDRYSEILGQQKYKYFKYVRSCAFNKKFISQNKKDEVAHSNRYNKMKYFKDKKSKKLMYLDNNPNKSYIYKKILYSQSFEKMIGRYDRIQKKNLIEKKLDSLRKEKDKKKLEKKKPKLDLNKKEEKKDKEDEEKEEKEEIKNDTPKKPIMTHIISFNMDKMLQRGYLPEHNDVRIRTTKAIDIKQKSPTFLRKLSSISFADKKSFSLNNFKFFSSQNVIPKNNLLINENKRFFDDKTKLGSNRFFSGISSSKDLKLNKDNSFTSNIFVDKSPKKELVFTPEFKNLKRNFSSTGFNTSKKNNSPDKTILSYTFNTKNKTSINFHENKTRNKNYDPYYNNNKKYISAVSFRKMLSREYVNRIHVNTKIGAGMPLTPNYSAIYPKIVMSVKYRTKKNLSKKHKYRETCGINIPEKKTEEIKQKIYFSKMFGRGNINPEYPMFMDNINQRNAFDFVTVKSLKMNHSSKRRFNNPISSFNNKKSFNINISNNNLNIKRDNIKNIKEMKEKENRIKIYNSNIKNIFKKVIYDDIIDKNDITEDIIDFEKNPKLIKTINLSYKNLMLDYYKLNLDYLDKNFKKKKIDGITFQEIKSQNKMFKKNDNNPFKISESEIKT